MGQDKKTIAEIPEPPVAFAEHPLYRSGTWSAVYPALPGTLVVFVTCDHSHEGSVGAALK